MTKVGILVGSLRKNSISKKIATNIISFFPENFELEIIEIEHLPFYNQDFDDNEVVPQVYTNFRNKIKEKKGFLFVTPEYNRSVPAILKNAIDIGSRPKEDNAWNGKPAGIISQSPGNLGGFGANHHLRQVLTCINMPVVQQPEIYLSTSANLFNEKNQFKDEKTVQFLQTFVDTFIKLLNKF